MRIGKVVGTVVATQKDTNLVGKKLLVVQEYSVDGQPMNSYTVAVDTVGAGKGEVVLTVSGSSARLAEHCDGVPVDASIVAIVDSIECDGKKVEIK